MNIQQKMRLTVCVTVCLAGFLIMGHIFGVPVLQSVYAFLENALGAKLLLLFIAAFMVVFGAAGIRLPMRTPPGERKIVFHSEYGDIEIQLNSVERNIQRVLKKLPEIYKVKVRVFADESKERAVVEADCVLAQHPDTPDHARQVANRISGYIALMARKTMGLEELATIKVNVVNVHYEGDDSIFSILEARDAAHDPMLLAHDADELEVVDSRSQLMQDFAEAPTPFFTAEDRQEATAEVQEEESAPQSAGPVLKDDLGSDFDDFDFASIHDASVDEGHEISHAGFEMADAHETEEQKEAGKEPDFKIVDMRVKEKAEEAAAALAEKSALVEEEQTVLPEVENETQTLPQAEAKNPPKPKRNKGRKGKKR